jgi:threonine synthase
LYATHLKCRSCNHQLPLDLRYSCPRCGGILEVIYDYAALDKSEAVATFTKSTLTSLWRFAPLLPVGQAASIISLGEGNTPLLLAERLGKKLGVSALYLKNEGTNPTASFKDRPTSVGISVAKELGASRVIIASSGNAGAAAAAYAARGGLRCIVVMPEGTPLGKVAQAVSCGARVIYTRGSYTSSYKLALDSTTTFGWVNLTSTFLNPYTVEGDKTVAFEIWEQLGRRVPDWVVIPIGAGPLLVGTLKGFEELRILGLTDRVPAMIGVQSEAVHPVADAFASGEEVVTEWYGSTKTVSSGIADPLVGYPQDGTLTLRAIKKTNGQCLIAPDKAAIALGRTLAETEGVFVEPTSSIGIHAVRELKAAGIIRDSDTVVIVLTGHGLKTPDAYTGVSEEPPVADSPEALQSLIESDTRSNPSPGT